MCDRLSGCVTGCLGVFAFARVRNQILIWAYLGQRHKCALLRNGLILILASNQGHTMSTTIMAIKALLMCN